LAETNRIKIDDRDACRNHGQVSRGEPSEPVVVCGRYRAEIFDGGNDCWFAGRHCDSIDRLPCLEKILAIE